MFSSSKYDNWASEFNAAKRIKTHLGNVLYSHLSTFSSNLNQNVACRLSVCYNYSIDDRIHCRLILKLAFSIEVFFVWKVIKVPNFWSQQSNPEFGYNISGFI